MRRQASQKLAVHSHTETLGPPGTPRDPPISLLYAAFRHLGAAGGSYGAAGVSLRAPERGPGAKNEARVDEN